MAAFCSPSSCFFVGFVFVPSFYMVMDDLSRATGWLFGRFFGKAEDESLWEPIDDPEHATPAIATAEAMSKPAAPRLAAE